MRKYWYIGVGGFFGSIARVLLRSITHHGNLPVNTLFINVVGCFLLAAVLTAMVESSAFHLHLRMGLATGLIGAFTTFSSVCKETATLLSRGDTATAFFYIALSLLMGLAAVYCGVVAADRFVARIRARRGGDGGVEQPEEEGEWLE